MVSNFEKATAISRLKLGESPIDISADLGLPTMLIREWQDNLDITDLVKLQANTNALSRLSNAEITTPTGTNRLTVLTEKIEEVAIEIIDQVSMSVMCADPSRAKALQLMALTCATLYTTLLNKGAAPNSNDTTVTLFQQFSRD